MALHQTRFKIFMVIGIIVLTIFIYASYYSNSAAISLTNHIHSTSSLVSTMNSNSYSINSNNNNNLKIIDHISNEDNKSHNKKLLFNKTKPSNNTNIHPNNIQLVINNAEKILKNLTVSTSTTTATSIQKNSSAVNNGESKTNEKIQVVSNDPNAPSAIGVRIPIVYNKSKITKLDPSKGIITKDLYESGHLDANPNLCPDEGRQLRLFIIVTSAPKHVDARLSIRQTWGHYSHRSDVSMAFILGRTNDPNIEEALNKENNLYNDLVRGRFVDSYNNLTLKTISSLEWIDKECSYANFVLKTDDDMFINVPKLLQFIDKQSDSHHVIYGRLAKKWKPIRNKKSKYYVAPQQFANSIFPLFTTGPAYLMTSDVIHDLYLKSLEQTYLKLEDVYTTGIVAQLLGIKRIHINEFLNRRIAFNPCNIRKAISVHMIKSDEQFDLWKKLLDQRSKCK